ncbi:hypothetical protein CYLTODRAFT_449876 [Cylindrobasidium torrendii FP15055 ss-10]|uniref:Uncharacterized protein n=1 Tax=Cylindrobasidium torrendii FP15055 ss-10 TaxID=1314674 RepID=A0A0D7BQ07_9AGAR|nr:hypothetical protein CYLTODRAFT_449876 [Cylindrobasidium torrendii FP15055 ss-10]
MDEEQVNALVRSMRARKDPSFYAHTVKVFLCCVEPGDISITAMHLLKTIVFSKLTHLESYVAPLFAPIPPVSHPLLAVYFPNLRRIHAPAFFTSMFHGLVVASAFQSLTHVSDNGAFLLSFPSPAMLAKGAMSSVLSKSSITHFALVLDFPGEPGVPSVAHWKAWRWELIWTLVSALPSQLQVFLLQMRPWEADMFPFLEANMAKYKEPRFVCLCLCTIQDPEFGSYQPGMPCNKVLKLRGVFTDDARAMGMCVNAPGAWELGDLVVQDRLSKTD